MDQLGRDKVYATEWVERTFEYVRSARTVTNPRGEFVFIFVFEDRPLDPKKDLDDLITISDSLAIYDSNLYVDVYYYIYKVKDKMAHVIAYIAAEDLLAYNHNLITLEQVMDKLAYKTLYDDLDNNDKDRS
jgi:hypothetical protein